MSETFREVVNRVLDEPVSRRSKRTRREAVARAMTKQATDGNVRAASWLRNQSEGLLTRSIAVTGPVEFVDAEDPAEDAAALAADTEALTQALARGARVQRRNGSTGRQNGTGGGTHG